MSQQFHPAVTAESLAPNSSAAVEIAGVHVLICNADGEFFAIEDKCPHQTAPLAGGRIRRCMIACPLHGMRFDLRNGKPMGQLTNRPLRLFAHRIVDGIIEVALD